MSVRKGAWDSSPLSHELEATDASGWLPTPLRMTVSASKSPCRPKSPLLQLSPPSTSWVAAGATAQEDPTTRCSYPFNGYPQALPRPSDSSVYRSDDGAGIWLAVA